MRGSWTFSRKLALGFAAIVVALVATTVEATREIELSTKQQTSAVEQVHVAIAGLSRTTRETEAGATQTLQTSSQLTSLSTSLTRLVQTT
jgi:methyl-accepting chemotaxis protein